jgi:hypothetical protein
MEEIRRSMRKRRSVGWDGSHKAIVHGLSTASSEWPRKNAKLAKKMTKVNRNQMTKFDYTKKQKGHDSGEAASGLIVRPLLDGGADFAPALAEQDGMRRFRTAR